MPSSGVNRTITRSALIAGIALLAGLTPGNAGSIRCRVTYVTTAQIYFEGGKEEGLSSGDTLAIARGDTTVGSAVLIAVSSHSAVGRPLVILFPVHIGDVGTIQKERPVAGVPLAAPFAMKETLVPPLSVVSPFLGPTGRKEAENVLTGRVAVQYDGQSAEDPRLDINQASAYAHMRLENLEGTGLVLALYGQEYYDMGGAYLRYGDSTRSRFDVSELSLSYDRQNSPLGFNAGRFISRYATGVGALDGGEVFVRQGPLTAGALAGGGVQSRVMGIGGNQKSVGGFLAYHQGDPFADAYDASAAYVRQTVNGNVDRDFVSLQNSLALGSDFQAYASADVELKEMTGSVLSSHPYVSSLLLFVNYVPVRWLSTNFGYDGTRSVYLFESMKSLPDSLFHEAMRQGFRLNGTARLGMGYTVTADASFSTRAGDGGSAHTLGAGVRVTDIFSTRIFASFRYRNLGGAFLNGDQTTVELGRKFSGRVDILLRYDSRSTTVDRLHQTYTRQTFGGDANVLISSHLYGMLGADYSLDNTMNGLHYLLQFGYRF